MTADKTLVERLRMFSRLHTNHFAHETAATLSEAADRIEALERQVAELAAVGDAAVKALAKRALEQADG